MMESQAAPTRRTALRLVAFYAIGLLNTLFGYGTFALLTYFGAGLYVAQTVGHVSGCVFNYFSYGRLVFRERKGSPRRFLAVYVAQYFVSVFFLSIAAWLVDSPYLAGFITLVATSIVSYVALNSWVYRARRDERVG